MNENEIQLSLIKTDVSDHFSISTSIKTKEINDYTRVTMTERFYNETFQFLLNKKTLTSPVLMLFKNFLVFMKWHSSK